jgi:hypothetical protein
MVCTGRAGPNDWPPLFFFVRMPMPWLH